MATNQQQMLPPSCPLSQFSFVVPIFFRFCSNQQFLATETTIVVFKQHVTQSVAGLCDVAGDSLRAPSIFWEFSVENSSPSTIWGRNFWQDIFSRSPKYFLHFLKKKFFSLSPPQKVMRCTKKIYKIRITRFFLHHYQNY